MMPEPNRPVDARNDLPADDPGRCLSALVDGEADALERGCGLWRGDARARQIWHAYHLIGDVLRSEELARSPARDAAFVAGLRDRLAAEPVVLAPAARPARPRQAWLMPAAAAAGFVVVAGVLVVARLGQPGAAAPSAMMAGASAPGFTAVSAPLRPRAQPQAVTPFIRDPQLDDYLRAHQAASGGVAAAAPGGTLRNVDVAVPMGAGR